MNACLRCGRHLLLHPSNKLTSTNFFTVWRVSNRTLEGVITLDVQLIKVGGGLSNKMIKNQPEKLARELFHFQRESTDPSENMPICSFLYILIPNNFLHSVAH